MKYLNLTNSNKKVLIDDEDEPRANQYKWFLHNNGYVARNTTVKGKSVTIYLHRFILNLEPGDGLIGDHRKGDKLDYRKQSLRVGTPALNAQNRRKKFGASKYRGVARNKKGWMARAQVGGKRKHLGTYTTELQAAIVAEKYRLEHMEWAEPDERLASFM